MEQHPWEELYQKGDTQWDKGAPSPGLVDFLAARPELPGKRVLIPGCGTGHDVRAWAAAGFEATGLDLAPTAVRLAREKTEEAGLQARFLETDFLFRDVGQFDCIFEHTLFCAINPSLRASYVQAVRRTLQPEGNLIAVFYMLPEDEEGPPFGVTREAICALFEPELELLDHWVPRSYSNRTGLEWMTRWRKRPV